MRRGRIRSWQSRRQSARAPIAYHDPSSASGATTLTCPTYRKQLAPLRRAPHTIRFRIEHPYDEQRLGWDALGATFMAFGHHLQVPEVPPTALSVEGGAASNLSPCHPPLTNAWR